MIRCNDAEQEAARYASKFTNVVATSWHQKQYFADLGKWEGDDIGGCIGLILVARVGLVGSILVLARWSTSLRNWHQNESLGAIICPAMTESGKLRI